jgi:ABC-type glycerol-3-phosphate transport system permease component
MSAGAGATRIARRQAPAMAMDLGRSRFLMVFSKTLVYVTLLLIMAVQAFPLVWMILTSVKNQREVFSSFLPQRLDFSNFVRVWKAIDLPTHLLNSLYVTTLTVVIVVIVATLAGYVFARFNFRGKDWLFYIFIAAMMIPGQAILIPMFQFLKTIGLLNTLTGLSLSYLGGATAFSIFLMRAFFVSLPRELGDAAKMDGAGEWGVFWYIYLPLAKPGVATVVIIQSMGIWNEFMFSNTFISSPQSKTIQAALFQAVGRYSTDYTALSSGLMLALIPIFTIFLILQKQFIQGLTAGAVKG